MQKGDPTKQTRGGAGALLADLRPSKAGQEVLGTTGKCRAVSEPEPADSAVRHPRIGLPLRAASPPQAREGKRLAHLPSTHRTRVTRTGRCAVCRPDQSPSDFRGQSPCKTQRAAEPPAVSPPPTLEGPQAVSTPGPGEAPILTQGPPHSRALHHHRNQPHRPPLVSTHEDRGWLRTRLPERP